MSTEPYTASFGAIPRPEEPERPGWAPRPVYDQGGNFPPPQPYTTPAGYPVPSAQYSPFAPAGPQANAAVINNIRVGGNGYGRRRCNHVLHATLTVLSCGLWAPVWALAWLASKQS